MDELRRAAGGAVRLTLVVLGIGLVASLLVGVVLGAVIGDFGRGIGEAVAVGMSVTAVVGVAINLLWRGASGRGDAGKN